MTLTKEKKDKTKGLVIHISKKEFKELSKESYKDSRHWNRRGGLNK